MGESIPCRELAHDPSCYFLLKWDSSRHKALGRLPAIEGRSLYMNKTEYMSILKHFTQNPK